MLKSAAIGSLIVHWKKFLSLASLCFLLLFLYLGHQRPSPQIRSHNLPHTSVDQDDDSTRRVTLALGIEMWSLERWPPPDPDTMNDRWIVVTSIFEPTADIKKLANIPGWKLVVVGDQKSPKNWKEEGVVFLSIEDQHNLGFETVDYLDYGVYQRKNVGYLYAIHHGAQYIYDTDDDNHPYNGVLNFHEHTEDKEYLMYHSDNRTFYNGFAHFGQSTLWPRGLPLDMVDKAPVRTYKKCKGLKVMVQQGVVDGDPDVDAIQRLTRKDSNAKFVVYFDREAPPVVFPNDVGGHVAYFPPNAYQLRNAHNYLQDFYEEYDLYHKTHLIVRTLQQWKGTGKDMLTRHLQVVKELYKHGILGSLDVHLARAWCRDLLRVNYKPPQVKGLKRMTSSMTSSHLPSVQCEEGVTNFVPVEMPTIFNRIGQKNVNVVEMAKNASFLVP